MSKKKINTDRRNGLIKIVDSKKKIKVITHFYRRSGMSEGGPGSDTLIISSFFTLRAVVFLACENSRFSSLLATRDVSRSTREKLL